MNTASTSSARQHRAKQPRYSLDRLKTRVQAATDTDLAALLGLTRNEIRNLRQRGITWARADELAIACDLLPWQVWPEWAEANPEDWCAIPPDPVGFDILVADPGSHRSAHAA